MGNKGSPCHLMTHILVNLEDHRGRVEVHLVLVHQHREAPDLLSHRSRHLQQRKCAGEWPEGTWLHSTAPGAPNRLQETGSASLQCPQMACRIKAFEFRGIRDWLTETHLSCGGGGPKEEDLPGVTRWNSKPREAPCS